MSQSTDHPPDPPTDNFRAGMIAIIGLPNVGKSTFLNRALDAKIAITSPKPQTTRDKVAGILTREDWQIVFLDTPGYVTPRDLLHESLAASIREALDGVDGVLHLRSALKEPEQDEPIGDLLATVKAPVIEAWNKIDRLGPQQRKALAAEIANGNERAPPPGHGNAFLISALKGLGIEELLRALCELLPQSPPLYSPEDLSDRDLRFLASEIVREKVFELLHQEIPYSVATRTDEYIERGEGKHFIRVLIYVEHESQKGVVIGSRGAMLKEIGQAARPEIEELADHSVYLELHVKVRKNWTKKADDLIEFGYRAPQRKRRRKTGGRR